MKSVSRDFLLSLTCFPWKMPMTDSQMHDGWAHNAQKTYQHLACSCMDNTCGTDLNCTSKPWDSAKSDSFPINTISALWSKHSPPSLEMNSSLWYLAWKTDYISPHWHQQLRPHLGFMNGGAWQRHNIQGRDWDSTAEGVLGIWKKA